MGTQVQDASTLSRRRFMQTAAAAATAGAAGSLASPAGSAAVGGHGHGGRHHHDQLVVPPKPIPGGLDLGGGNVIHVRVPGDPSVTFPFSGGQPMGFDVEPATLTDFEGFSAVAFHAGTATGSDGATYDLETDMRAYKGAYVDSAGTRRFGTFAFI
jgi:hypothetical protein